MSDADKQARLAEALRANLRKRKAQAREHHELGRHPGETRDPEPKAPRS